MLNKKICAEKINDLKKGYCAYAESSYLIRKLKQEILNENLQVIFDYTKGGCFIIPLKKDKGCP